LDDGGGREVEPMNARMHRIAFDCRDDVEASLLEAEAQAASSAKKVDGDRTGAR